MALAMTYIGARGKNRGGNGQGPPLKRERGKHFPRRVQHPDENFRGTGNLKNELLIGNALWLQKDYPFYPNYKEWIQYYFQGLLCDVDFRAPEGVRGNVNAWIAKQLIISFAI